MDQPSKTTPRTVPLGRRAGSALGNFFGQSRRDRGAGDAAAGFYESSFDLRTGLEVSEAPLAELPEEFKRQLAAPRSA
jgi:hypothetical protein